MINLMILYLLLKRDLTMYSIKKHIKVRFSPFTNPSFGALNPALKKLESKGYITSSKIMSEGGKLSVIYSITDNGQKYLRSLMLEPLSINPLQFISDSKIKLSCASFLAEADKKEMFDEIKSKAYLFKSYAQDTINDEYSQNDFYQKIVLDNTICEYNNFISMIEGFEKE